MTDADSDFVPGEPEDVVGSVVAGVLGLPAIGRDIGFFDLGASSADISLIVGRLRERWPDLRAVDVFLYPTVSALAAHLGGPRRG